MKTSSKQAEASSQLISTTQPGVTAFPFVFFLPSAPALVVVSCTPGKAVKVCDCKVSYLSCAAQARDRRTIAFGRLVARLLEARTEHDVGRIIQLRPPQDEEMVKFGRSVEVRLATRPLEVDLRGPSVEEAQGQSAGLCSDRVGTIQ